MSKRFEGLPFLAVAAATTFAAPPSKPIYALANDATANKVQFGTFDLGAPTGSLGSYSYAWTSLGGAFAATAANLAVQPGTGDLYLTYTFDPQIRTISRTGVLGTSVGISPNSIYGMAFQANGALRAVDVLANQGQTLITIDPANGQTTAATGTADLYSSFGGNLTSIGNTLYWANVGFDANGDVFALYQLGPTSLVGTLSGTGFDGWEDMSLFAWDSDLYLLNANRVYQVNTANGSLTLLGTVTGAGVDIVGFTGAVGNISSAAVPEPSTYGLLLGVGALALAASRRRSRRAR